MSTTQQHLSISDIKDDIILLKDGGGALVLQISAVNFGLLSEREQIAIISAFAQMLNSLSFSIQILIFSERLNINSYLILLDKAQKLQSNPMLSNMIINYRQFIQNTIRENDVLDKKFYVVIPLFNLELGLAPTRVVLQQKIKTILLPRRNQIIRQLSRVGLKAIQLNTKELIELFYDIYNGQFVESIASKPISADAMQVQLNQPQEVTKTSTYKSPAVDQTQAPPQPGPVSSQPSPLRPDENRDFAGRARTHPFVVEELDENT